jgi:hypothetical protein
MGILHVELFGGVRVTHDNWLTEVTITRELQLLLAYLLLQRHRVHSRDVLAGVFWGEQSQEKARGSLNTALWKLKKILEPDGIPHGTYLKFIHPGEVDHKESSHWLDIEILKKRYTVFWPALSNSRRNTLGISKVLGLYKANYSRGVIKIGC